MYTNPFNDRTKNHESIEMDDFLSKIIVNTPLHIGETPIDIQARYQVHIPELTPELIHKALKRIEDNPTMNLYELAFYRLKTDTLPTKILQSKFLHQFEYVVKKFLEPWEPEYWQNKFDANDDFCLTKAIFGLDFLKEDFKKKALEDT